MRKLIIIGAGGHGRVVADVAQKLNMWQEISFLDDAENVKCSLGFAVIGPIDNIFDLLGEFDVFIAIGNGVTRERIHRKLKMAGANIPTIVHPSAVIGAQVEIGEGTVVMPGVVINCGTRIGQGCIINTGATIDHDGIVGDYVHISPGVHIAGTVKIGKNTWLGVGSLVSNNIEIVDGAIIGAGAVVVEDIKESGTYVGIPAKKCADK